GVRGPRRWSATSGGRLYELAGELVLRAMDAGALLIVNDRVDVALAAGADGVQLGARSLALDDAAALLGDAPLIGVSTHVPEEGYDAVEGGADFLVVGHVYETPSHPGREGAGTALVEGMALLGVPVVAIGGVTPERVAEVRGAGAAGVAAIRGVWDAPDPARAVRRYLDAWHS
ncbi:MAG TPA: thiamine phosphate synthase, partial [Longimicrobium sp.]|nr:thiamine phosphate synthase [Longimicrobium sp.]